MSVDFAAFDPNFAPREGAAFRAWYERQMDWDTSLPDPDPNILTKPLHAWYEQMTAEFPDLNRSISGREGVIDYCFTPHFIYCSMDSRHGSDAYLLATNIAGTLRLGTYDPMNDDGRKNSCIVFPDGPLPDPPSFFSRLFSKSKG